MIETGTNSPAHETSSNRDTRFQRASWFVYGALFLVVFGLLDQFHAKAFCLGNAGVTGLRIAIYVAAVAMVMVSVGTVIPPRYKKLRIYYSIASFFVGFWIVSQPSYYVAMRTDVGQMECVWTAKRIATRT